MDKTAMAVAAIGVVVDSRVFVERIVKVKTHDHDFPESMKFSPETGRRLWEERRILRPEHQLGKPREYDSDANSWFEGTAERFGGFLVLRDAVGSDRVVLAVETVAWASEDGYPWIGSARLSEDLDAAREGLRALLEPLGAWDEESFGLHAILRYDD